MRQLSPMALSASSSLFALDVLALLVLWPAVLAASGPVGPVDAAIYPLCDLLVLYALGLYRREAFVETRRSLSRLPLVVGLGAGLSAGVLTLLAHVGAIPPPPPGAPAWLFATALVCFAVSAFLARVGLYVLLHRGLLQRRILVVGAGRLAWEMLYVLQREGRRLHYDIFFLHLASVADVDARLPADRILPLDTADVPAAAKAANADVVVVAPDERRGMDLQQLMECKKRGFPVVQYLTFMEKEIRRLDLKRMELGWLLYSDGFQFGWLDRSLKRLVDVVVAGLLLIPAGPLLLGGMLAIRLGGPGPVFYRQERVTQDGRPFHILKLRTMRVDAEAGRAVWAASADPRITPAGRFLRRTRVDELPQLLNILRGQMSFVGPRPERPVFVEELASQIPLYHERHMVKAGLTGWAQVNYPYGASVDDARSKLSYDLYYVKNFSVLFDVLIIMQTLRMVLWPTGVR